MRNQLGTGHELAGRFDLALEHFATSLEIAKACGHVLCEQSALEWHGITHGGKGDLELALRYLNLSFEMTERVHDPVHRGRARILITMYVNRLLANRDCTTSVDELNRALSYLHVNGEDINGARVLMQLASAHVAAGQQRLAASAQERVVALFARHNATALQIGALRALADTEDLLGEREAAQEHRLEAYRLTHPD
ncbi:hypothetical protein [Lentzea flava]|nr:hypothetical protein [Lentzea flava]MCP2204013.1 hypothetical protein [Lentzea flava]